MKNQMQDVPLEHYFAKYFDIDPFEAAMRTGICYDKELSRFTLRLLGCKIHAKLPE